MSISGIQSYSSAYGSTDNKAQIFSFPQQLHSNISPRSLLKNTLASNVLTTPVGPLQVWQNNIPSSGFDNPLATGQPIMLLIHGLGGEAKDMEPLVQALIPYFPKMSFVGVTLPEIAKPNGNSIQQHHFSQQSIAQVRNTIDYLIEQPEHPPLYILAYSLGAPITVQALSQSQSKQNTAGLLLLAPAFDFSPTLNKSLYEQDSSYANLLPYRHTQWQHNNELRPIMRQSADIIKQNFQTIPHHIFISQNDDAVSFSALQESLNEPSELTVLANGSHDWMNDPYLSELATQIAGWMNNPSM
jgi:alpha-beta hydrolase superfamily lysophospholipase